MPLRGANRQRRGQRPQEVPVIKKHTLTIAVAVVGFLAGFFIAAQLHSQVREVAGFDKNAIDANTLQNDQLSKRILWYQKENARLRKLAQ